MQYLTIYRVTHPKEQGCYMGVTTASNPKQGWSNARSKAQSSQTRLGEIARRYPAHEFVFEILSVGLGIREEVEQQMQACRLANNATWNILDDFICKPCNRIFRNKMTLAMHQASSKCINK